MTDTLQLRVDGRIVEGFESGSVSTSMDSIASSFSLRYAADRLEGGEQVIIEAGDAIELAIDDEVILAGYVDADEAQRSGSKLQREIKGRSRLGDLVDCTAYVPGRKRWRDASLITIASDLTVGYGIPIYDRATQTDHFERWEIRDSESIAGCIQRAAKVRGVVLVDEGGDLALTFAGEESTQTILRDTNTTNGRRSRNWQERFSEYLFRTKKRPTNAAHALADTSLAESIGDEGVTRLRRNVVFPYGEKAKDVERRSVLERNVRRGRAETLTYTVPGWRDDAGELWRQNTRVRVIDPMLDVDATMLIIGAKIQHGTDMHRTELTLTLPSAFDQVVEFPVRQRGRTLR